jgi:hypothetical protein
MKLNRKWTGRDANKDSQIRGVARLGSRRFSATSTVRPGTLLSSMNSRVFAFIRGFLPHGDGSDKNRWRLRLITGIDVDGGCENVARAPSNPCCSKATAEGGAPEALSPSASEPTNLKQNRVQTGSFGET